MTDTATRRPTLYEFITAERIQDWLLADETIEMAAALYRRGCELVDSQAGFGSRAEFCDVRIEHRSAYWSGTEICLGNSSEVNFTLPIFALLDGRDVYLAERASAGEAQRNRRTAADRAEDARREADRFRAFLTLKAEFEPGGPQ